MKKLLLLLNASGLFMSSIYGQCNIVSGESGSISNGDLSATVNYTATISGGSEYYTTPQFSACGIDYPQINTAWTGNAPEAGIIDYAFDQPILSVRIALAGVGLDGQALQESFTFTTDNEVPVIAVDPGSCADWIIEGNTATSPDVNDGLNSLVLIYSKSGFSNLTITSSTGNDVNGGSFVGFCDNSLILAPVVGVNEFSFDQRMRIYPNPSSGISYIDMGKVYEDVRLRITDLSGKIVTEKGYSDKQIIELTCNYPAGVYIVHLQKDDLSATTKLIVD